jgi:hypothetical protein
VSRFSIFVGWGDAKSVLEGQPFEVAGRPPRAARRMGGPIQGSVTFAASRCRRWKSHRPRFSPPHQSFHLIEHPIEGVCSSGPWPVLATCFIASKRSRRAFAISVVREASSRPRYCSPSCALKPKKSGVH